MVNAVLERVRYGWKIAHRKSLEANPRLRLALASRLLFHARALYAAGF